MAGDHARSIPDLRGRPSPDPPQVYALPAQGAGIRVDAAGWTAHAAEFGWSFRNRHVSVPDAAARSGPRGRPGDVSVGRTRSAVAKALCGQRRGQPRSVDGSHPHLQGTLGFATGRATNCC